MIKKSILFAALAFAIPASHADEGRSDVNAGKTHFNKICVSCHGPEGKGIGIYPKITGKTSEEVESLLTRYRAGKTVGPSSPVMVPNARLWYQLSLRYCFSLSVKGLTDQQIRDISAYVASLPNG